MPRGIRIAAIAAAILLVLVLVLGGTWLIIQRRSFPKTNGTVELEGVSAPVEVYRDEYGVPHIYARTPDDLFFAQGYVHAQDRFWQMEFWRRIGAGRLSEYFGESTLSTDIFLRTVRFAETAEQEFASMDPESRRLLEAYADGVNAYALNREPSQLSLEFTLLEAQGVEVEIEPWSPVNSLTWAKVMAYDLGGNMENEIEKVELIRAVGTEMVQAYIPSFREDFPYIVPDEELELMDFPEVEASGLPTYLESVSTSLAGGFDTSRDLVFGKGDGIGSNNWVISGDLTTTGMPLLANDPHLGIRMPSIWYEVGLHCVDEAGNVGRTDTCPYNLRGYSFAGSPGVIIGHNDRIVWGVTNIGPDTQDLYIERINPENPNQYEVNGEWAEMAVVAEEIIVQGEDEPYILLVRTTRHGPIISDQGDWASFTNFSYGQEGAPGDLQLTALSLRWTAIQTNTLLNAIWQLNRATNYEEFREAVSYWDIAAQNVVYADVDGNIAYQSTGLIPIRARGDGSVPVPGWTDEYEWTGYIPFDDLPRSFNPAKGYVVTANQWLVSDTYPYLLGTEFNHGFRGERIRQMIESDTGGISIEDMAAIQGDNLSLSALEITPYLQGLSFDDPGLLEASERLGAWDGQMHMDSPEGALYGFFYIELVHETFDDHLPEELRPGAGSRTMDAFYGLLQKPDNEWWDDIRTVDRVETRDDILVRALTQGYDAAVERMGEDINSWKWGEVHTALFANETFGESGIPIIEAIFNRGPVPASGGSELVNAVGWSIQRPFEVVSVPSMRQIIDLSNLSNSLMMHTTGQSGHAGHRHYDDFIDPWRLIEYHPTFWERAEVEENSREHLRLIPVE